MVEKKVSKTTKKKTTATKKKVAAAPKKVSKTTKKKTTTSKKKVAAAPKKVSKTTKKKTASKVIEKKEPKIVETKTNVSIKKTTPTKPKAQTIRIRLKTFDHKLIDISAKEIVEIAK